MSGRTANPQSGAPPLSDPANPPPPQFIHEDPIYVGLTHAPLDIPGTIDKVRTPKAGAIVMFAGTTRDNFNSKTVKFLAYSSYTPLALRTLQRIAKSHITPPSEEHGGYSKIQKIAILHRLGEVPVGEESILVVVSAGHRKEGWEVAEEVLEECKRKLEVWKWEELEEGDGKEEGGWRSNREGVQPVGGPGLGCCGGRGH
ncbi:Molybdopterin biosynthesis MoaE [Ascobolus immersus RN42]|uniref:Molybdopterin biosynthesis MoaE n=1 Tax=Ascobolus immersus RN42 TaxID=1160509 RepID=A0A3N4ILY3_ASCIM|nr:Molybdopterin biosynthesis MoaE [Ascobolus immersus RN42]